MLDARSGSASCPERGAGLDGSRRRAFLRVLGAPEPAALEGLLRESPPDEADVEWLVRQGLASYAYCVLAGLGGARDLATNAAASLRRAAMASAYVGIREEVELTSVLRELEKEGVDAVFLKGSVLAHTVYPEPWCRPRGDIDFWIAVADYPAVQGVLSALGYREQPPDRRPLSLALRFGGETQFRGERPGLGLVEPHFQAFVGEWARNAATIDRPGVWARRVPFRVHGATGASMAPEDMLLHLCVHFGVNHQFAVPALRALLDVHLLARNGGLDWDGVVSRARAWRTATVTWAVLSQAVLFFDAPVPGAVLGSLAPGPARRALIRLLRLEEGILAGRPAAYTVRRGVIWLLMTDRAGSVARFLGRILVPEPEWLRNRYGAETGAVLPLLFRHWASLLLRRRS